MIFRALAFGAGGGLMLGAAAVWGIQGLLWLEDGKLPPVPLRLVWEAFVGAPPAFAQPTLQRFAEWALTQNAGLGLFLPGIALVYLGYLAQRAAEARANRRRGSYWDD